MATQIASLFARITADTTGFASGLASVETGLAGLASRAGSALMGVGTALSTFVTLPLLGLGAAVSKEAGDFEAAMNMLEVRSRGSGTSIDQLRELSLAAGSDLRVFGADATDVAEALTQFYMSGLSTNQIIGNLEDYLATGAKAEGIFADAVDLAASSSLSFAEAARWVPAVMATWGKSSDEVRDSLNHMVRAADSSLAEVDDMLAAYRNVGPVLDQFGVSLEDANVMLALLSQRQITGATAGTALRSMFNNMIRDVDKNIEMWEELGTTIYDESGNLRAPIDIFEDLREALAGVSDEERNLAIKTIAGTYGQRAMAALIDEGAAGWLAMEDQMSTAADMLTIAEAKTKGFNAALDQLKKVGKTFMIEVGTPIIENFLTPFIQKVTEGITSLSGLNPKVIEMGFAFAAFLAALGPIALGLGLVLKLIGFLLTPIGLVSAALAALALAWTTNMGGIQEKAQPFFDALKEGFETIKTKIGEVPGKIAELKAKWDAFWAPIQGNVDRLKEAFSGLVTTVSEDVSSMSGSWESLKTSWNLAISGIYTIVQTYWPQIRSAVQLAMGGIVDGISTGVGLIERVWTAMWPLLQSAAITAMAVIRTAITGGLMILQGLFMMFTGLVSGDWNLFWQGLQTTANSIGRTLVGIVTLILNAILGHFGTSIAELVGRIQEAGQKFYEGGRNLMNRLKQGILDAVESVKQGVSSAIGQIAASVRSAISRVATEIREGAARIKAAAEGQSPSKLYMRAAATIPQGITKGLTEGIPQINKAMKLLDSTITSPGALQSVGTRAIGYGGASTSSRVYNLNVSNTAGKLTEQGLMRLLRNMELVYG